MTTRFGKKKKNPNLLSWSPGNRCWVGADTTSRTRTPLASTGTSTATFLVLRMRIPLWPLPCAGRVSRIASVVKDQAPPTAAAVKAPEEDVSSVGSIFLPTYLPARQRAGLGRSHNAGTLAGVIRPPRGRALSPPRTDSSRDTRRDVEVRPLAAAMQQLFEERGATFGGTCLDWPEGGGPGLGRHWDYAPGRSRRRLSLTVAHASLPIRICPRPGKKARLR